MILMGRPSGEKTSADQSQRDTPVCENKQAQGGCRADGDLPGRDG